jgi:hypothetical protein
MITASGIGGNQQTHKESIRAQAVLPYLNVSGGNAQIGFIGIQLPRAYNGRQRPVSGRLRLQRAGHDVKQGKNDNTTNS